MKRKYILTDTTIIHKGHTIHQIQAVRSFDTVKEGDLGGFVESERNLSHDGNCWIFDQAMAYEKSRVLEDAKLYNQASVSEHATIEGRAKIQHSAKVFGHAMIREDVSIFSRTIIGGKSIIYGKSCIAGRTIVSGNPRICGNTVVLDSSLIFSDVFIDGEIEIYGNARILGFSKTGLKDRLKIFNMPHIGGNAKIRSNNDFLCIGPLGSRFSTTTFYRTRYHDIWVSCGCFNDSIKVFEDAVHLYHKETEYFEGYMRAIRYAKEVLG